MTKICLFAGTTEGRRLTNFLKKQDAELTVCVATEYGGSLIDDRDHMDLSCKRLSGEEILRLLEDKCFDLIIDATHPYAVLATQNIAEACQKTGTYRLWCPVNGLRPSALFLKVITRLRLFFVSTAIRSLCVLSLNRMFQMIWPMNSEIVSPSQVPITS